MTTNIVTTPSTFAGAAATAHAVEGAMALGLAAAALLL
jgi:hypothetical protein